MEQPEDAAATELLKRLPPRSLPHPALPDDELSAEVRCRLQRRFAKLQLPRRLDDMRGDAELRARCSMPDPQAPNLVFASMLPDREAIQRKAVPSHIDTADRAAASGPGVSPGELAFLVAETQRVLERCDTVLGSGFAPAETDGAVREPQAVRAWIDQARSARHAAVAAGLGGRDGVQLTAMATVQQALLESKSAFEHAAALGIA